MGSEAVHCRNVILRRITADYAENLLWLKFRPDTPQLFEYITVEDAQGTVDNFLHIHRWTQFYDLKDRKDRPASIAHHITLRRCRVKCRTYCQAPEDLTEYNLSDFLLTENQLQCDSRGNDSWIK